MAANNSATGGFLAPAAAPAPMYGAALKAFVNELIAGLTGLKGSLVRPIWQPEPPNVPAAEIAWCAFGIRLIPSDQYAFVGYLGANPDLQLQRHEQLNIVTSFYDRDGGTADALAARLRDGLAVPQNREVLQRVGMGLTSVGALTSLPTLLKETWYYRVDFPFIIAREVRRTYPVLTVLSAQATLASDTGIVVNIATPNPPDQEPPQ